MADEFIYEVKFLLRIKPKPESHHTVLRERLLADMELKKQLCRVVNAWREPAGGMRPLSRSQKLQDDFCLPESLTVTPVEA